MSSNRPNILFIMTDNQNAETLGCYGNKEVYTPNLDKMAEDGIKFTNAFCTNAMCSPCRVSALTGLMPAQHGVHTWIDDRGMDTWPRDWNPMADLKTLPGLLKENNYRTALIGKYHMGSPLKPQNGFDHWVTFPHGHTRSFWNNTVLENGRTYDYPGHTVDFFTEKAVEYIKESTEENDPFFIFLAYNAPYGHWPSIKGPAKNRFAEKFENCPMNSVPREGLNKQTVDLYDLQKGYSGKGLDFSSIIRLPNNLESLRNYYSQNAMVDDGVGKVLDMLEQKGMADNTLVIFTSDHGFSLGHLGYWGHGQATWPSNAHRMSYNIPLLVRHTGNISSGRECDWMCNERDLFATILDYAGVTMESDKKNPSRSFADLVKGRDQQWEDVVFIEQEETRAIRTREWLYMKRFKGSQKFPLQDELYDLQADPEERNNVAKEASLIEILQGLETRLDKYFQKYSEPDYDLWNGGSTKSNTSRPWLWIDAWGESWSPRF